MYKFILAANIILGGVMITQGSFGLAAMNLGVAGYMIWVAVKTGEL